MKKIVLAVLLMFAMLSIPALAGSIQGLDNEDCTDTKNVCVHKYCKYEYHGTCYYWKCDQWAEQCDDTFDTVINDNDVIIDADTVKGRVLHIELDNTKRAVTVNGIAVNAIDDYLFDHEEDFLRDSSGWKRSSVLRYLQGEYWTLLLQTFVPWTTFDDVVEQMHDRMDRIEAIAVLGPEVGVQGIGNDAVGMQAAQIKARRTGLPVEYNGYRCYPTFCLEVA